MISSRIGLREQDSRLQNHFFLNYEWINHIVAVYCFMSLGEFYAEYIPDRIFFFL